jgi:FMN phosphatase YigB (HAD superfamily)
MSMSAHHDLVFLFDCDNTLLDNDRVHDDLDASLTSILGRQAAQRYWAHYEALRRELGYADYLGAAQRLRLEAENDVRILRLSSLLLDYPFADRLYPGAREALARCHAHGLTALLSDGDAVFQPHKLQRAGLWDAVEGRVLIFVHKERHLDEVRRHYPAHHYVVVDDKLHLLTSIKAAMQDGVTTVWPRQGHYALDAANADCPRPDVTLDSIAELAHHDFSTLRSRRP